MDGEVLVTLLDRMLRGQDASIRVEEVAIHAGPEPEGKKLGEADLPNRVGTLIALQFAKDSHFTYNPGSEALLKAGTVLVVIGRPTGVAPETSRCP